MAHMTNFVGIFCNNLLKYGVIIFIADLNMSLWNNVRIEAILSIVFDIIGIVLLVMTIRGYLKERHIVLLVLSSIGFITSGKFKFLI